MATLELLKGSYSSTDAVELLTQLTEVKIKFHERKIEKSETEEDVKMREIRIRELQNDLSRIRSLILVSSQNCSLQGTIHIE